MFWVVILIILLIIFLNRSNSNNNLTNNLTTENPTVINFHFEQIVIYSPSSEYLEPAVKNEAKLIGIPVHEYINDPTDNNIYLCEMLEEGTNFLFKYLIIMSNKLTFVNNFHLHLHKKLLEINHEWTMINLYTSSDNDQFCFLLKKTKIKEFLIEYKNFPAQSTVSLLLDKIVLYNQKKNTYYSYTNNQHNITEICKEIKETQVKNTINNDKIPLNLFQTWKTDKSGMPHHMLKNLTNTITKSNNYQYFLYDNNDCEKFLEEEFGSEMAYYFHNEKTGCLKADLWRLCILYVFGGIYLDIDIELLEPLDTIIPTDADFGSVLSDNNTIFQAVLFAKPKCSIIGETINNTLDNYRKNISQFGIIVLYKTLYDLNNKQQVNLGYSNIANTRCFFYAEKLINNDKNKHKILMDKYCVIHPFNSKLMFNSRYEGYYTYRGPNY